MKKHFIVKYGLELERERAAAIRERDKSKRIAVSAISKLEEVNDLLKAERRMYEKASAERDTFRAKAEALDWLEKQFVFTWIQRWGDDYKGDLLAAITEERKGNV